MPMTLDRCARMIIAPSGAGKSYFVDNHPSDTMDGDVAIALTQGWPARDIEGKKWWKTEARVAAMLHWGHLTTVTSWALALQRITFFNGDFNFGWWLRAAQRGSKTSVRRIVAQQGERLPLTIYAVAVIPPEELHHQRLGLRRAKNPEHDAGKKWADILDNRDYIASVAATAHIPVLPTFEEAYQRLIYTEGQ